jgi:hypothetical protein
VPEHANLTERGGWQDFVYRRSEPPELLSAAEHKRLGNADRDSYDDARIDYHARLLALKTPTLSRVVNEGRRLLLLNQGHHGARRGLIVAGKPGTGKTTAVTALGKTVELRFRREYPQLPDTVPVIYITMPPAATPKALSIELLQFLGAAFSPRDTLPALTHQACGLLGSLRTRLVIVDEIHNLNHRTRSGAEASDHLKYLAEHIPATFVYAGIDLAQAGLFTGLRGAQIAGRFTSLPTRPFGHSTQDDRQTWATLIATFDASLRLHQHKPGSLVADADYLHNRTHGMIGSLSHLIRAAAIDAITDGTENITKAAMDRIPLDHAATTAPGAASPPARRNAGAA